MYQALYRKYRPHTFDDVVGQDFVIETIKNSISNKKINHAYLFFGPRGIGKTTIAKILARAVNCEHPHHGSPCEQCESCSKSKQSVDIIEIDAASNNGVDEIREIKSRVNIVPSELAYKVYIIDEVHMLTSGAFNALLKTLEEPPKHVIFILATTDVQKVSDTIVSRCQCYNFKRISVEHIVEKLKKVCQLEKIDIDEMVLFKIAEFSNGGLRDSLGMLDKLSSYTNGHISIDLFYEINDMISNEELELFKQIIIDHDYQGIIHKIKDYNDSGKNVIEIISQLLISLRNDMINYYINKTDDSLIQIKMDLMNLLNEKMFEIKKCDNPKIYIEIMLLNFVNQHQNISREIISVGNNEDRKEKIVEKENSHIEKPLIKENDSNISSTSVEISDPQKEKFHSNISEVMDIRVHNILAEADKKEKMKDEKLIVLFNDYIFDHEIGYLASEILNATLRASSGQGIIFSYEYDSVVEQNLNQLEQLEKVYFDIAKISKKIAIISNSKWEKCKSDYINSTKNHQKYDIIEEPDIIKEDISDSKSEANILDMFGNIVEVN